MKKISRIFCILILAALCTAVLSLTSFASEEGEGLPISYVGMSLRLKNDAPGMRAVYSVDLSEIKALEDQGYTVEFGAVSGAVSDKTAFRSPTDLTVAKTSSGYVAPEGSTAVCVYSSASSSYATNKFVTYDEANATATYAYTIFYRPDRQTAADFRTGIVNAGFVCIEKDGNSSIHYCYPSLETSTFYEDGAASLYEMTEYWNTRLSYKNRTENIRTVLRASLSDTLTISETKTATKDSPLVFSAEGMKEGVYALSAKGTASAKSYFIVETDGDIARQRVAAGEFDLVLANVYIDGDSTVTIVPEAATFTFTSLSLDLVSETRNEETAVYSINREKSAFTTQDIAGIPEAINPATQQKIYYFNGDARNTTSFDLATELSAGNYRVGIFYMANREMSVSYGETGGTNSSVKVAISAGADGSTGGGASFAWLGEVTFFKDNGSLTVSTSGSYINIMGVVLTVPRYSVSFYDVDGSPLSVQSVKAGGSAVMPTPKYPEGYVYASNQSFAVDDIRSDTEFHFHGTRNSFTASVEDGTLTSKNGNKDEWGRLLLASEESATVTLTGATAGYYEVSVDYPGTAVHYVNVLTSSSESLYRARLALGNDGKNIMTVWLSEGDNTLTVTPSGNSMALSSITFRNASDAYGAVRLSASSYDEEKSSWVSGGNHGVQNGCLMFRTGDIAVFDGVEITEGGQYAIAMAGCTTGDDAEVTVKDESGNVLLKQKLPQISSGTSTSTVLLPIPFTTFSLSEGTHTISVALSQGSYLYIDALVLIPHNQHIFGETEVKTATCSEKGYVRAYCRCGLLDEENYRELPVVDHDYQYIVTEAPTCYETGMSVEQCLHCGLATGATATVAATGHSEKTVVARETSCARAGLLRTYCTVCNETFNEEEIPVLPHGDRYVFEKRATCTSDGYTVEKCVACDAETGSRTVYSATGVHEGRWVIITEPSVEKRGYAAKKCIYCEGTLENKKLARFVDASNAQGIAATDITVSEDSTYATMKVTAAVDGFYEIRIQGHASTGKYFNLSNTSYDAGLFVSQKDKEGTVGCDTNGFAVYLKKGENTLKYSIRNGSSTAVSIEGATAHLISEQTVKAYVRTQKSGIPAYTSGTHEFGTVTVSESGFYRASAFLSAYTVSACSFTLTSSSGETYTVAADVSEVAHSWLGSSNTSGYDAFSVLYLPADVYTVSLTVQTTNKLQLSAVFLTEVKEAEGAYYIHIDRAMIAGTGTGEENDPYVVNTVEGAYMKIKSAVNHDGRSDIIVSMSGGEYKLEETLRISAEDFVTTDYSITFAGAASDKPVSDIFAGATGDLPTLITSLRDVKGSEFTLVAGTNYYSYKLPDSMRYEDGNGNLVYPAFRDLYVNGVTQTMASSRPVNLRPAGVDDYKMYVDTAKNAVANGLTESDRILYLHPSAVGDVELDADGNVIGDLEYWVHTEWQTQMVHIEHIDKNPAVSFTAKTTNGFQYSPSGTSETLWACRVPLEEWEVFITAYYANLNKCVYYMKNNLSYLDEPGEFFYDRETGTVYLCPDGDISKMTVSFPALENLVELFDTHNIIFDRVNFTGTTVNFPTENAYFSGQGGRLKNLDENGNMINAFMPNGAVYGKNVKNIAFYGCDISELGGDAINFRGAVEEITVSDCRFVDIGGSAVRLGHGGAGMATKTQYTEDAVITQNYIRNTGAVYTLCTAIHVTAVRNLEISYNTILDSAYSAISVGWSWGSLEINGLNTSRNPFNVENAIISYNYIENFLTQMQDGGAIYVLGGNASMNETEYLNSMNNNVVVATTSTGNGVNRFTVFYHDSGSSHWHDYDNVLVMDPNMLRLRFGVVAYQTNAPAYNNLTERLYFIGYQDDRVFSNGKQVDDTGYVYYRDETGKVTSVTDKNVSAGWLFMSNNPGVSISAELKSQHKAYINPDGSYSFEDLLCLQDAEDHENPANSSCPLVANGLTHDHHIAVQQCYMYYDFEDAVRSAQYDAIEAIVAAAGCNGARCDMDKIAAMFDNMPIHCPSCWSTNIKSVSGKGYRCYDCCPSRGMIQEWLNPPWYFSLIP